MSSRARPNRPWWPSPPQSAITKVALTLALPALALLVNEWLRPQLEPTFEPVFMAVIAVVCWLCGPSYAIASLVVSSVLLVYFFIPPYYSFELRDVNAALKLCFFLGANAVITGLISNLYSAQRAVARSEKMYRNLSELIPFGGWVSDADGDMQHLSDSFLNAFGTTLEECRGLGWTKLIDEDQRETVISEWEACMRTGYFWDYEYRMKGRDGERRVVLSRGVPVTDPAAARPVSWVGMHLDVTAREESLEEQIRQARDLARFNAELEQLAYVSAHDLQEPLRMIASYMQLLQRRYSGKLDPEADEFIGYAVEGANRLRSLLQDLMMLQNVGKGGRTRQPYRLNDLVDRAIENLGPMAAHAKIECDTLPRVGCDDYEFTQLFEHLLMNAIKYARQDVPPEIHITADSTHEGHVICVSDNGIGIDAQYRYRIFDVFQRLHPRSEYPGTGIGLSICRKIVEVHGGRIWVESTPGSGSSFCFTVPVAS